MLLVRQQLGTIHQIAAGGTAKVYVAPDLTIPGYPGCRWVYKEYKPAFRPPQFGMEQLSALLDRLDPAQRVQFERCLNWPVAVVAGETQARAAGVVLPLITDDYFVTIRQTRSSKRKPAEGQFLFQHPAYCGEVGIAFPDNETRLAIVHRLCYAIALLHRAGVVFGDMSSRNFIYRLDPRPGVILVDCDAVRLEHAAAGFGLQPHTPDWEPPEALAAKRRRDNAAFTIQNQATDRYKLGLAILRIMTPGVSSSNRNPDAASAKLPAALMTMLRAALSDTASERPAARDWYVALQGKSQSETGGAL